MGTSMRIHCTKSLHSGEHNRMHDIVMSSFSSKFSDLDFIRGGTVLAPSSGLGGSSHADSFNINNM